MKSHVFHTVWCNISGEVAGETWWNWSLLGVKGLKIIASAWWETNWLCVDEGNGRRISVFSLGLNDRAQRPVVLFGALSFFLSALSFFQRPVIFRKPFGFFGLLSALFWAWICRKRPIKAKGGAIFAHHVVIRVGHRRHPGFTSQISAWEWGYANGIWRNVIFALGKCCGDLWISIRYNEY